jgi:hypothetical protein
MTKEEFSTLRTEMVEALGAIATKYNCDIEVGNIKYDDITTSVAVTFHSKGKDGKSADQLNFEKYCNFYGFKAEDYGRVVVIEGKNYSFVGFNPKARKNYCLIRRDGKTYATSVDSVKYCLAKKGW